MCKWARVNAQVWVGKCARASDFTGRTLRNAFGKKMEFRWLRGCRVLSTTRTRRSGRTRTVQNGQGTLWRANFSGLNRRRYFTGTRAVCCTTARIVAEKLIGGFSNICPVELRGGASWLRSIFPWLQGAQLWRWRLMSLGTDYWRISFPPQGDARVSLTPSLRGHGVGSHGKDGKSV